MRNLYSVFLQSKRPYFTTIQNKWYNCYFVCVYIKSAVLYEVEDTSFGVKTGVLLTHHTVNIFTDLLFN